MVSKMCALVSWTQKPLVQGGMPYLERLVRKNWGGDTIVLVP
jgi:hypothetical protein